MDAKLNVAGWVSEQMGGVRLVSMQLLVVTSVLLLVLLFILLLFLFVFCPGLFIYICVCMQLLQSNRGSFEQYN